MNKSPKYSIIIPAKNGVSYLPSCVDTIISQGYSDYELIISDDHSTDGSKLYLATLHNHPNIQVLEPPQSLSMTEHWEWALSQAKGQWIIFVGQDDGLQPYFFKLSDNLTALAKTKKIRTIMSERAYFFWPGCEFVYGNIAVNYYAKNKIKIHNSRYEALKALLGIQSYFELPEMYTTSLFNISILDEAREKQEGKVLTCHPQDANLGVIACSLDNHYLQSSIPLGWVGSSLKSAGMAIASSDHSYGQMEEVKELEREYKEKIKNSTISYHDLAGDFSFDDAPLYLWQAFLKTPRLREKYLNEILISKFFRTIFFAFLKSRLLFNKTSVKKSVEFSGILKKNDCSYLVNFVFGVSLFSVLKIINYVGYAYRIPRKIYRMYYEENVCIRKSWKDNADLTMAKSSKYVLEMIQIKRW